MHRLGIAPEAVRDVHAKLSAMPTVADGIVLMHHFASSDDFEGPQTPAQLRRFAACTEGLPGERSMANSAAVLGWPASHGDWIRPGGALYGIPGVLVALPIDPPSPPPRDGDGAAFTRSSGHEPARGGPG